MKSVRVYSTIKSLKSLAALSALSAAALAAGGCGSDTNYSNYMVDPTSLEIRDTRSREMTEGELPASVASDFHALFPKARITRIDEKRYLSGKRFYRVHFVTEPGAGRVWDFNPA